MKVFIKNVNHIHDTLFSVEYQNQYFGSVICTNKKITVSIEPHDNKYDYIQVPKHLNYKFLGIIDKKLNESLRQYLMLNTVTIQTNLLKTKEDNLNNERAQLNFDKQVFEQQKRNFNRYMAAFNIRAESYKDGTQRAMAIELLSSAMNIVVTGDDVQDYKRMATKAHPDKQGGSEALMKMVNSLYGK